MSVNPVHSPVFGNLFSTPEMRAVFDDSRRFTAMARVEAALARAQAATGVIPIEAADAISRAVDGYEPNMEALRPGTEAVGLPVVALVRALVQAAGEDAGRYLHWGATTQDIMDTGFVLQMREGIDLLRADLETLFADLAQLADRHRMTVMAGRTHMQHALPITFGLKCATWLNSLIDCRAGLEAAAACGIRLQFAGAAGTLASLGEAADAVADALAAELDLPRPPAGWHATRDAIARIASELALLCGALGKIAGDIALLMQTEVAEVFEPAAPGRGGSSTMPQKRNPVLCEYVLANAANVRQLAAVCQGAMVGDHERATGPWQAEWLALPQAFALTSGALSNLGTVIAGLEVDAVRMRQNLDATGGLIMAEAVMMALAPHLGRERAHDLVEAICRRMADGAEDFAACLAAEPEIATHLTANDIAEILRPESYIGNAEATIDAVLTRWRDTTTSAA